MLYSIEGNAEQFWIAFNQKSVVRAKEVDPTQIEEDLTKAHFLGTYEHACHYLSQWSIEAKSEYYVPGNITGAVLEQIQELNGLFQDQNESFEKCNAETKRIDFAFVNDDKQLCGLTVCYRHYEDGHIDWVIGLITDTHLEPQKRNVQLLSNKNFSSYAKNKKTSTVFREVEFGHNPLINTCKSEFIGKLISQLLVSDATNIARVELNPNIDRLALLLQFLNHDVAHHKHHFVIEDATLWSSFFSENESLDALKLYQKLCIKYGKEDRSISFNLLKECVTKNSVFRNAIEKISLNDERTYMVQIALLMECYRQGVFFTYQEWIERHLFSKIPKDKGFDEIVIQTIALLLKLSYDYNLIETIISNKAHYTAVYWLNKMGFAGKFAELFKIEDKVRLLDLIETVKTEELKKVCLIFWVYGNLSKNEYATIIANLEGKPHYAKVLLEWFKPRKKGLSPEVSIEQFQKTASSVLGMEQLLTHYQLQRDYGYEAVEHLNLTGYSAKELESIGLAFSVLCSVDTTYNPKKYAKVFARDNEGHKLRMYLGELHDISDLQSKKTLINILFTTVEQQEKEIRKIDDEVLAKKAKQTHDSYLCVTHLQELGFDDQMVGFVAKNGDKSVLFRNMLLNIHHKMEYIRTQMKKTVSEAHFTKYHEAAMDYKRSMYEFVYKALTEADFDYECEIKNAELRLLYVVDPKTKSWLATALIVIANIVITILTIGIANDIKESRTGNYWFFNSSPSLKFSFEPTAGEELCRLSKSLTDTLNESDCPSL